MRFSNADRFNLCVNYSFIQADLLVKGSSVNGKPLTLNQLS